VAQVAGIGRYTRLLAEHLALSASADDALRLFYLDFRRRATPPDLKGATLAPYRKLPGSVLQRLWRFSKRPYFDDIAGAADVFHFTNFIAPPMKSGSCVATIFDMSFERFPQFAEDRNLRYLRAGIRGTVERADAIITISDFSAAEITELLPAARGKVRSIPLGISPTFKRPPEEAIAAMRQRLGIKRPYLLTVGTIEPRKNLPFLVDVFNRLDSVDMELVIAGMPGWKCEPILDRFANARCSSRIHYLRYVPDGDLAALYAGASLFVVPSFYEGFGFPPLEAMACGTPVVSSAGGSLPEVVGDSALVLSDFDPDHWATEILRLLGDSDKLREMSISGIQHSSGFRWEETARRTWEVYREVSR
jgi:glycosyltransferase involved in cell wall biosynthesis